NFASMSKNRGVASAITPPGRMYDVCIRKPEISSFMSMIVSRSRKQYMSTDIAPSSMPLVPSHTRCEERRVSSHMITPSACARGGRSEERRVGKEGRGRGSAEHEEAREQ